MLWILYKNLWYTINPLSANVEYTLHESDGRLVQDKSLKNFSKRGLALKVLIKYD